MSHHRVIPLGERLVVQPLWETHSSTVWTPEGVLTTFAPHHVGEKRVATKGRVLAVGAGRYNKRGARIPLDVRVGAIVHFSDSCHRPFRLNGAELYMIRESDIAYEEQIA